MRRGQRERGRRGGEKRERVAGYRRQSHKQVQSLKSS